MNPHPPVETGRQAFDLHEFCYRNSISVSTYHKLKRQGRAPREMVLGRAIRISIEAERDWRTEREQPSDTEARLLKRETEARVRNARKAAAKSVASPKHISKQPTRPGRKRAKLRA